MVNLEKEVQYIKGVGPNRAELLHKLGLFNLEDIINYFPKMYEDRSKPFKIAELEDGEDALIEGLVVSNLQERRVRKGLTIYKVAVQDDTGICEINWYNQAYLKQKIKKMQKYKFYGKVSKRYGKIEVNSPIVEETEKNNSTGKIIPVYSLTYQLTRKCITQNNWKCTKRSRRESRRDFTKIFVRTI